MTSAVDIFVVTASDEQIPRIWSASGLLLMIGSMNASRAVTSAMTASPSIPVRSPNSRFRNPVLSSYAVPGLARACAGLCGQAPACARYFSR